MNLEFWKNRSVFVTGHTGFKGGWISLWLSKLGAKVHGYSLAPPTLLNFFELTQLKKNILKSSIENILDLKILIKAIKESKPSVIIHMAAQPIVRESYKFPLETFKTNVIGTANILEAAKHVDTVKAIINVTTDKCYENQEQENPYVETDRLGGYDPYASSKACAELVSASYRNSFLNNSDINLATVRGGNVIGGGDWAKDRLIPDFFRAAASGDTLKIRHPEAIRPWQHVLEPLSGYLMLAEKLVIDGAEYAEAWNFGPNNKEIKTVSEIAEYLRKKIKDSKWFIEKNQNLHETTLLQIDSSKAQSKLGWKQKWDIETTLNKTIDWYEAWLNKKNLNSFTISQIEEYENI